MSAFPWFVRFFFTVTSCILCILPLNVLAKKKVELYTASQLVLDESPSIRNKAASTGLATVIVRVGGNRQVLQNPLVKEALSKAATYILQYSYQSTDETLTILGDTRPARRLQMQFSSSSVQRLFKTAQLPIWPDSRSEVLLWVSGERQGSVLLDKESAEISAIKRLANERGLPVFAPLLDLTDRQQLSAARIRALDEASIRVASTRYGLDVILAGRIHNAILGSNPWRASFILLDKIDHQYFRSAAPTLEQAARQIIDQVTSYFANKESIVVSDESLAPSIDILVDNVQSFEAYAGLLSYLKSLPVVASVMVNRIDGSLIKLELGYNGGADKLLATLSSSELLQAVPQPVDISTPNDLSVSAKYIWR